MTKTEKLKNLAAELNEKFPVGSIVKITALKDKDGFGYFQDHPECKMIIRPFFYVASDMNGDECVKYYYADLDLLLSEQHSIDNYECLESIYFDNDWSFELATIKDVRISSKKEIDWRINIEKKDINRHREKIKHFRELRHRVTENNINSVVEYILNEEKKKSKL